MLNKVSICLMTGGHSFSNSDIEAVKSAGRDAVVEFVTHKTLLRPAKGFDEARAKEDLEAAGYVVADDEVVVSLTYTHKDGKVYTFAINGSTGKIYGELPVSQLKLAALMAAVAVPATAVLSLIGGALL